MKKPFRPISPFTLGVFSGTMLLMLAALNAFKKYENAKYFLALGATGLAIAAIWSIFRPGAKIIVGNSGVALLKHEDGPATKFCPAGKYTADGVSTAKGSFKVRDGATVYVDSLGNVSPIGWLDDMAIEELTDWRPLLSQKETGW